MTVNPTSRGTLNRPNQNLSSGHIIKAGDSLSKIAKDNNVSLADLAAANPQIKDINLIRPGQEIKIPTQSSAAQSASPAAETAAETANTATAATAAGARAVTAGAGALRRNQMTSVEPGSIDEVRNGSAQLLRGSRGPAVADLQKLLNQNGANLQSDGIFGPKTEAALKQFQRSRGIDAHGTANQATIAKLDQNAPPVRAAGSEGTSRNEAVRAVLPQTQGMTEAQKYDYYSRMITQNGGELKTGTNERNLVALRVETDADVNGGKGSYDDRMAMLWTDKDGNKRVREYNANTEPNASYRGRYGEDADGDGRIDQGRLPAGHYEYTVGHSSTLGNVLRPTKSVMAERDTNHDGLFNDNAYASAGRSMLIHSGSNSNTGSAGCQTMAPGEYNRFWKDINSDGNPGKVGYTVINL